VIELKQIGSEIVEDGSDSGREVPCYQVRVGQSCNAAAVLLGGRCLGRRESRAAAFAAVRDGSTVAYLVKVS
jgi:hypothetical protein